MNHQSILIVDDHRLFAEGISSLLVASGYTNIEILAGGSGLMDTLKIKCPDLLLMDITMDDLDGITLSMQVKKKYPAIRILIVSMHARRVYIEKALQAGVDGYIIKNASDEELKTAVASLLDNKRFFSPQISDILLKMAESADPVNEVTLTVREKEILKQLAEGYSTKEIADRLFLSVNTVETHRKNILFKTGLRNTAHLIKWGFESGQL
jgi:DNA-binding NarL/FixJ family response regulator